MHGVCCWPSSAYEYPVSCSLNTLSVFLHVFESRRSELSARVFLGWWLVQQSASDLLFHITSKMTRTRHWGRQHSCSCQVTSCQPRRNWIGEFFWKLKNKRKKIYVHRPRITCSLHAKFKIWAYRVYQEIDFFVFLRKIPKIKEKNWHASTSYHTLACKVKNCVNKKITHPPN